jgi:hypothetical protein
MTKIIDLGNGRGMLTYWYSPYANLHIELKQGTIRRLYTLGYLSKNEYFHWLDRLGYAPEAIKWLYALDSSDVVKFFRSESERLKRKGVSHDRHRNHSH